MWDIGLASSKVGVGITCNAHTSVGTPHVQAMGWYDYAPLGDSPATGARAARRGLLGSVCSPGRRAGRTPCSLVQFDVRRLVLCLPHSTVMCGGLTATLHSGKPAYVVHKPAYVVHENSLCSS